MEDWQQSTLDFDLPVTARVVDNTMRILDLCAGAGVRGTFFVLGLVAAAHPGLVRSIREAGHEVASHGHDHRPVHAMTPGTFRADLRHSRDLIQQAIGAPVIGYRAPDFSISSQALWALTILAEEGYGYDSSLFPFAGPRYGIAEAFDAPCRVRTAAGDLLEFPLATGTWGGVRLPAAGGGYFRFFPYAYHAATIRSLNRHGSPAVAYFHPYEIDTEEIPRSPHQIPLRMRLSQGIGRSRVAARLGRLLRDFPWGPMTEWLQRSADATAGRLLDLTGLPDRAPRWTTEVIA